MTVFISWSGQLSKQVAELIGRWVEDVLQGAKAWISMDDIDKGSIWFGDITKELSETSVGILCLTRENLNAPWILFEAGGLSKGLSKARVCPLLVNLSKSDLTPPLSQFNATLPSKDDMLKLVKTINSFGGDKALSDERLVKTLDRWWTEFEVPFADILENYKPTTPAPQRPLPEIAQEILDITRSIQRSVQQEYLERGMARISGRTPMSWLEMAWADLAKAQNLTHDDILGILARGVAEKAASGPEVKPPAQQSQEQKDSGNKSDSKTADAG